MSRRKNKMRVTVESESAAHRRRQREREDALRGHAAPPQWEKGGVTKKLNPKTAPMTRSEIRELTFKLAVKKRREGGDHMSSFSKPSLGSRRRQRRFENKRARVQRKEARRA